MNFLNLAKTRYTTKRYDSDKKISEDKMEQLKEILRLSPSSINSQPWKFTFISDEIVKSKLAGVSYFNQQKINEASHLVVFSVIDNIEKFELQIEQNLPEGAVGYYKQFIKPQPESEIKAWLQHQVYLSLGFFLSASASLEIDSTPMEGIEAEKYQEILNLEHYKPLFAVALGYRNPQDENQPSIKQKSRLTLEKVVEFI
jgi:nitroreductase/dihydropteridine reductase